jgi:adenosylmethionine-8-amino-7-oxononanoate aminotransferase
MCDHQGMTAFLHPFSYPGAPESDYVNIVRGEGALLWDDAGKQYIDGIASLWLCQVGHGRRELVDAVVSQAQQLATYNTFAPMTNSVAVRAADMIAERSPHPDGRVFLACSGSEAVDTALKLARLVPQRRGETDRQIIIRRTRGYHGTNFGGTTAQGLQLNREGWGDLVPHFVEVDPDDIEAAARVFAEHRDRVAAVITEPLQGAGGVWPPPDGYLEGLRRLCDDHGSLLIFDEVITAFGRLGHWFGSERYGVTPDLITFAKGVTSGYQPLSGVVMSKAVGDALSEGDHLLRHGYTYSGHPIACAAAIANIEVLEADNLLERARTIGQQFEAGLEALRSDGLINGWRGEAAIFAVDIDGDPVEVRNAGLERGVIYRPIGTALAMSPPLVTTDEQVATMIDTLADLLRR